MNIPFLSFEPQHAPLREAMTAAFSRIYDSYWYVPGEEVKQFEQEYAAFNQLAHTVGVANGSMIHYPVPPHLQQAYQALGFAPGSFPIAKELANTCLSLPMWPGMTEAHIVAMADAIRSF